MKVALGQFAVSREWQENADTCLRLMSEAQAGGADAAGAAGRHSGARHRRSQYRAQVSTAARWPVYDAVACRRAAATI